jgi:predicted PhzF superfamily epimerase YddE/YHI9
MSTTIARASRKIVERVSARVFCHLEDGGNPVTIFACPQSLTKSTQERLAKDCQWESVMVHHPTPAAAAVKPQLSFYMPSGEQVSFCAHAAMGAALEICLANENRHEHDDEIDEDPQDQVTFTIVNDGITEQYLSIIYDFDIVALEMNSIYTQKAISQPSMLYRMLRNFCRIDPGDLASKGQPTAEFERPLDHIPCHASIARAKTLVPLHSLDDLHNKAQAPKAAQDFALSCKALDDTTGLYLYAKSDQEDGAWQCRQFPRASGYPEDPATGIAAAALACHLYQEHGMELPTYKMYQGTAMGKPSLIVVDDLTIEPTITSEGDMVELKASYRLLGRVEIDERDTIEVDDNEDEVEAP